MSAQNSLIIFTSASTGLGHIRVMDALRDGLPIGTKSVEVGITNVNASRLHLLGSRNRFLLWLTEFIQNHSFAEWIYTIIYTNYLKGHTKEIVSEFEKLANDYPNYDKWIIVSTHFALAYSIGSSKAEMEEKFKKDIKLCVVVTDDSPQRVWAVTQADAIFVPSEQTAIKLSKFVDSAKLHTVSFPISPRLTQALNEREYANFKRQLDPDLSNRTHIEIPISGAAVQLSYLESLIKNLEDSGNFEFTIVGEKSEFTQNFFDTVGRIQKVQLTLGTSARQTVNIYESLFYQINKPAIEVTKPSEQMFKALATPNERGGLILLLTPPIGRQEYDNLNFLIRHGLAPDDTLQAKLEELLIDKGILPFEQKATWYYQASHFRAIRLPKDPKRAAKFIAKLKETGILFAMLSFVAEKKFELTPDGVAQIWQYIGKMLQ